MLSDFMLILGFAGWVLAIFLAIALLDRNGARQDRSMGMED